MKVYRTEVILSKEQIEKFNKTVGTCRFIYNLYISENNILYELNKNSDLKKFMTNIDFQKYLNHEYLLNNEDKKWIKEISTKSIRYSIDCAYNSFKKFFKGLNKYPRFKKKSNDDVGYYFVRNNKNRKIKFYRHKINIPCFGYIRFKEYGYIPLNENVISGIIKRKAGKYFISILTDGNIKIKENNTNEGIGIDLGIKQFAVCSNGMAFDNINKTKTVKNLSKKLKYEQRKLSRKINNKKKGEAPGQNLKNQLVKVQRLYLRLSNIRNNYLNQTINTLVKTKPKHITIEDLNIKGMIKNRHLSKAISEQCFNKFVEKLKFKCFINSIELRKVDRFYPSSKTCSNCGNIKKDLKLSDRAYKCDCGLNIDRDLNAAINLKNATEYKIIT